MHYTLICIHIYFAAGAPRGLLPDDAIANRFRAGTRGYPDRGVRNRVIGQDVLMSKPRKSCQP